MRISFSADEGVRSALERVGRTEDVQFSPSGRRVAVAGYKAHRVLVFDVLIDLDADPPKVAVSGCLEVSSPALNNPHGVSWIDDDSFAVANRHGHVTILALPADRPASGRITLDPLCAIGGDV